MQAALLEKMAEPEDRPAGIGKQVRALREALGMRQEDLAVKAELTTSTVAMIEQGKTGDPRLSTLRALAKALGVSLDELTKETGEKPK